MDISKCGAFIATLRKEKDMTQKQLAAHLGVTDKAVSRWETGKGLPDADSMLALSELFDMTINELLHAERAVSPQAAEEALADVLHLADCEKRKRHRLRGILVAVCVSALVVWGLLAVHDVTAGGGKTLSTVTATCKTWQVVRQIENGSYEKAVDDIGFSGRNRRLAEEEWIGRMHSLFDGILEVRSFTVFPLEEEDQFISGKTQLRIYDPATGNGFTFEILVAQQDGIAFGRVQCIAGDTTRGDELAGVIADALCTYNPG